MRYPILTVEMTSRLTLRFLDEPDLGLAEETARWVGAGAEVNLKPLDRLLPLLKELHAAFLETPEASSDKDRFEGRIAGPLHSVITTCALPSEALDDPGFWRYLALTRFWWFVSWREKAFTTGDARKYARYIDGKSYKVTVLVRTFNRGRLSLRDGNYHLAYEAPQATDLWQSHILGVNTSYSPEVARAVAERYARDRLTAGSLRVVAKAINRTNTNVVTVDYDPAEAEDYIDSHWSAPSQDSE